MVCKKDFGYTELKKLSVFYVCDECNAAIKNRIFPLWVKAFLLFTLLLVLFAFAWNWKYYQAFQNIKKSGEMLSQLNYSEAYNLMSKAGNTVQQTSKLV